MSSMIGKEQYNWLLPCVSIFLMIVFTGRDIGGFAINPYLTTLLICGVAAILPYSQLVSFATFMLPLSCGIQSFAWVAIIACLLYKGKKISPATIFIFIIVFLLELVGLIMYEGTNLDIKKAIFYLVSFFVVMYLTMNNNKEIDYSRNIRYFIYGTAFLFAMIYIRVILEEGIDEVLAGAMRYSMDDKELTNKYVFFTNANNLGLYSSVCFAALLLGAKRLEMPTIWYVIAFIIIICGGAFSLSRTWLITSVLSLVLYLLFSPKNGAFVSIAIVCAIIALLALNMTMLTPLYEMFGERLTDDDITDGAGRTDLFQLYHTFFSEHPKYWLTGTGAMYYFYVCGQPLSMHNSIQQIYVCYGFIGAITFLTYFIKLFRDNVRYVRQFIQYVPFIIYIIFAQTVQIINPIYCMYPLVLAVYCLRLYKPEYEL